MLAANGRADKSDLGDHSPAGYGQCARFYAICVAARNRLASYDSCAALLDDIAS